MSRRLRNEFVDELDELDYRLQYRNYNERKGNRQEALDSPRGRGRNRPRRERKENEAY
ncbi:MAG: hypothetical protein OQK42_07375 [Sedimenticola sp.]|nr:hypothetical protein [Sedimenticola sp.]MCW8882627.1 hypothetical protein [Sedimenticola sp.]MCW8920892.1 hypothetical protein [Sedimenticola sp.]MCW8946444.1 hypothetical protein [Sedimenticola sp.]MCW8950275.1 hypothetical protein [Sedimenticola sp.]